MSERSLKKLDRADIELDTKTNSRVIESLVTRGDISALSPEDKSRFYIQTCESLGLNPATHPFALLKLNGKEILYPTRGVTDQLAAIHKLNREIIDGPKVIDIAGTKMGYCVCRATHPNGRVETAVATVPLGDLSMLFMKLETKAKRRATLSILGLSMLDESEVADIPASAKSPAPPIDMTGVELEPDHQALAELRSRLADGDTVGTFEVLVQAYDETVGLVADPDVRAAGLRDCYRHLEETLGLQKQRVRFKSAIDVLEHERAAAKRAAVATPPHPVLVAFNAALEAIEIPGECVAVWIRNRAALAVLPPADRETAWRALCARCETVGKMKNAKVWLKRAIAEEDARAGRDPDDGGPRGGGAPRPVASNDAPAEDDPERAAIQAADSTGPEASLRAYLAAKYNHVAVRNAAAAHVADYALPRARYVAVCAERLVAVTPGLDDDQAVAIVERAIQERAAKLAAAAMAVVVGARKVA